MRAEPGRDATRTAQRHLLGHDRVGEEVGTRPPVLLLVLQAEQPELAAALVEGPWEVALRLPLLDVRPDLALDEVAHRRPKRVVFGREEVVALAVHRPRIFDRISRMTSSAPPPMRISRESRHARWTGTSIRYAAPPKICIASFAILLTTIPV